MKYLREYGKIYHAFSYSSGLVSFIKTIVQRLQPS